MNQKCILVPKNWIFDAGFQIFDTLNISQTHIWYWQIELNWPHRLFLTLNKN